MESSHARDQTRATCIGRQFPIHCYQPGSLWSIIDSSLCFTLNSQSNSQSHQLHLWNIILGLIPSHHSPVPGPRHHVSSWLLLCLCSPRDYSPHSVQRDSFRTLASPHHSSALPISGYHFTENKGRNLQNNLKTLWSGPPTITSPTSSPLPFLHCAPVTLTFSLFFNTCQGCSSHNSFLFFTCNRAGIYLEHE